MATYSTIAVPVGSGSFQSAKADGKMWVARGTTLVGIDFASLGFTVRTIPNVGNNPYVYRDNEIVYAQTSGATGTQARYDFVADTIEPRASRSPGAAQRGSPAYHPISGVYLTTSSGAQVLRLLADLADYSTITIGTVGITAYGSTVKKDGKFYSAANVAPPTIRETDFATLATTTHSTPGGLPVRTLFTKLDDSLVYGLTETDSVTLWPSSSAMIVDPILITSGSWLNVSMTGDDRPYATLAGVVVLTTEPAITRRHAFRSSGTATVRGSRG